MRIRAKSTGTRDRVLLVILIAAISAAIGMLGYTIANPPVGERYTEFYTLGLNGKAADYPEELVVGEEARVIVGIINRERQTVSYSLEIRIDGAVNNEIGPMTLNHNEKWEQVVGFTPDRIGDRQKVEFLLYRQGQSEVYQELYLWVDVTGYAGGSYESSPSFQKD